MKFFRNRGFRPHACPSFQVAMLLAVGLVTAGGGGVAVAQTLPSYSSLRPLPGTMEGKPIVVSNNPESISRQGLLLANEPMTSSVPGLVTRTLTGVQLDANCPSGGMKEFAFYMHHLMSPQKTAAETVNRVWVFIEPVGATATVSAYGAAVSERDYTGGASIYKPGGRTPSYAAAYASLSGHLPAWYQRNGAGGSQYINISRSFSGPDPLFVLTGNPGNSVDARVRVTATQCVHVRVVATLPSVTTSSAAYAMSKQQYAWGNVPTASGPGGAPCTSPSGNSYTGWGRPAGIYQFERWRNNQADLINITDSNARFAGGWNFLAAPPNKLMPGDIPGKDECRPDPYIASPSANAQRSNALRYYSTNTSGQTQGRDSDQWSTSNYGAESRLKLGAKNTTKTCMRTALVLTGYPGQRTCSSRNSGNTRHHDAPFKIRQLTSQPSITPEDEKSSDDIRHGFVECDEVPQQRLVSALLAPNETVQWEVETLVPGLISAPSGFLVHSAQETCEPPSPPPPNGPKWVNYRYPPQVNWSSIPAESYKIDPPPRWEDPNPTQYYRIIASIDGWNWAFPSPRIDCTSGVVTLPYSIEIDENVIWGQVRSYGYYVDTIWGDFWTVKGGNGAETGVCPGSMGFPMNPQTFDPYPAPNGASMTGGGPHVRGTWRVHKLVPFPDGPELPPKHDCIFKVFDKSGTKLLEITNEGCPEARITTTGPLATS